jgi:hypothetical protein
LCFGGFSSSNFEISKKFAKKALLAAGRKNHKNKIMRNLNNNCKDNQ